MKITIAELKRRLPVGKEFTASFIMRGQEGNPGRRVVKRNTGTLVSAHLEGPNAGKYIYLDWKGVLADERDGHVYLSDPTSGVPDDFVKFTIPAPE